jgi:hypothetical protein
MNICKSRAFRQGSAATTVTILGVVLIIVLNFVFSSLSTRLRWTLDLTPNRMFEITSVTRDFLAELDKDVNIYVLNSEDIFSSLLGEFSFQANEVIRRYDFFGPRINLQYVDIQRNPTFITAYTELNLSPNLILIESPQTGRRRVVDFWDLFDVSSRGQVSSTAEQVMTAAILNVTSDEQIRASVLGGYNQGDFSAFLHLLEMNNYVIVHENLMTIPEVDPDADIVFLVTPARDITEQDLRKLDSFLLNNNNYGKTLFYVACATQTPMSQMPNLSAWLAEWGIAIHDSVLFETNPNYRSPFDPFLFFVDYSANEAALEYSSGIQERDSDLRAASVYSRPILILFSERSARIVNPLLQTSPDSGFLIAENQSAPGPHPVLTLSTELRWQGLVPMRSHVLTSASYASFDRDFLGEVNFSNSEYFLNLLNSLAGREDTVRIQDKTFSIATMQMTLAQARALNIVSMYVLPVALLALGVVLWLRRRHR